ncbi:MAG: DUF5665 domain-containing protein [Elusimicrobiota bacterium]|nr:DUF5665 domain-containing protein [Elusimicrobiota bacterium]
MTEEEKKKEPEKLVDPEVEKELNDNSGMVEEITTELKRFFTFDILNYIHKPWKLMSLNFLMGLVRGIGFFLGMTIVGAIVFAMLVKGLQAGVAAKIPVISEWLAKLVSMVQSNMELVK